MRARPTVVDAEEPHPLSVPARDDFQFIADAWIQSVGNDAVKAALLQIFISESSHHRVDMESG
jgi:hypothetical protein